jgi:broad specificity phosphatase PhoE
MTRFLLVRHGQSEWNALGRWQGHADPPLSEAGREEAELAADALTGFEGRVFSSRLLRAKQTAEIFASAIADGTVMIAPDMLEIDVGDFSGLTNHEIEERMPEAWAALRAGRLDVFPGGEAREHFRDRILAALATVARSHRGEEILLVTHGGAIAAVERHLGVHPGVGVKNLEGRRFDVDGEAVRAVGDRVQLAPDQES